MKNYFYLIVGLLCILFAATHTWNGQVTSMPALDKAIIDNGTKTIFTYVWHIIGAENLVFGIALLIMSFYKNMATVKFTACLIIVIMIIRWLVISIFTVLYNDNFVKQLLPDSIAIWVVVILLLFGIRVKSKISNE